jgi:hypothetical protein
MESLQQIFERRFKELLVMDMARQRLTEALTLLPERQFACDSEVYSPWPAYRPFPKFETILKRWLDRPSPSPQIHRQVWTAAANTFSSVTNKPFVPYFMDMLIRALDPLSKSNDQIRDRIRSFSLIVDCFKSDPNYQIPST